MLLFSTTNLLRYSTFFALHNLDNKWKPFRMELNYIFLCQPGYRTPEMKYTHTHTHKDYNCLNVCAFFFGIAHFYWSRNRVALESCSAYTNGNLTIICQINKRKRSTRMMVAYKKNQIKILEILPPSSKKSWFWSALCEISTTAKSRHSEWLTKS